MSGSSDAGFGYADMAGEPADVANKRRASLLARHSTIISKEAGGAHQPSGHQGGRVKIAVGPTRKLFSARLVDGNRAARSWSL
ncbi:hypothetical protein ACLOJK_000150 [Asimina triloba]